MHWICELGRQQSEAKTPDPSKFHRDDGNPGTHRPDRANRIVFLLWFIDRICNYFYHYLATLRCRTGCVLEIFQDDH